MITLYGVHTGINGAVPLREQLFLWAGAYFTTRWL